ncbi:MAG: hypothetical protein PF483_08770 [Halothiobacillus sp.]|jgi:hypothetical protein|nr:hypothetical protein [Halothiobacillus sp.]
MNKTENAIARTAHEMVTAYTPEIFTNYETPTRLPDSARTESTLGNQKKVSYRRVRPVFGQAEYHDKIVRKSLYSYWDFG